jgi:hypothetical protein
MNITERNIWKLNNLPPMEYCSLPRAQKLLNCEIEDILHWHDIGAINLCLKLNPTRGTLKLAVLSHQEKEVTSAFNPLNSSETMETFWSPHSHIHSILRLDGDIPSWKPCAEIPSRSSTSRSLRQVSGIRTAGI